MDHFVNYFQLTGSQRKVQARNICDDIRELRSHGKLQLFPAKNGDTIRVKKDLEPDHLEGRQRDNSHIKVSTEFRQGKVLSF